MVHHSITELVLHHFTPRPCTQRLVLSFLLIYMVLATASAFEGAVEEDGDASLPPAWYSRAGLEQPPPAPRGAPLAEVRHRRPRRGCMSGCQVESSHYFLFVPFQGVIKLSASTIAECAKQMNATCMGRCLQAIKIRQLGPIQNITSVADRPMSSFWPPRSSDKRPCDCGRGFGIYSAGTRSAMWYFAGPTDASPPRVLEARVETGGVGGGLGGDRLVVRHAALGNRTSCPFVFMVASGLVMGLKSATESPSPHAEFPIWATILLSLASVLLMSGVAFVVIRMRSGRSSSSVAARQQAAVTTQKRGSNRGKAETKEEDVASLRDPLLLGEEGKAQDGK